MERGKRKRDEELSSTIITFHAPGERRFDRLFIDRSLDEMKDAVKKKLKVLPGVDIRLAQLRNGSRIDLEDEDDFDALCVLASKQKNIEISVLANSQKPPEEALPTPMVAAGGGHSQETLLTTPSQKKKGVTFDDTVTVGTSSAPSAPKLYHGINPSARDNDDPNIGQHVTGVTAVVTGQKRKRAATRQQEPPTAVITLEKSPPASEALPGPKPKKRRKTKKSKDIDQGSNSPDTTGSPSRSQTSGATSKVVDVPASDAGASPTLPVGAELTTKAKASRKRKASNVPSTNSPNLPHAVHTDNGATGGNLVDADGEGSSTVDVGDVTSPKTGRASPGAANANHQRTSDTQDNATQGNPGSFNSQLAKNISAALSGPPTTGTSPPPITGSVGEKGPPAKKGRPSRAKSAMTESQLREAVGVAVAAVLKRNGVSTSSTTTPKPHDAVPTDQMLTDPPPIPKSPKPAGEPKSAPSTAPADVDLTPHRLPSHQTSQAPDPSTATTQTHPLPIIPGSAVSEVVMERKDEGSSDDSSDSGRGSEETPWAEEKEDSMLMSIPNDGLPSLDDVTINTLLRGPTPITIDRALAQATSQPAGHDDRLLDQEESDDGQNDKVFRELSRRLEMGTGAPSSDEEDSDARSEDSEDPSSSKVAGLRQGEQSGPIPLQRGRVEVTITPRPKIPSTTIEGNGVSTTPQPRSTRTAGVEQTSEPVSSIVGNSPVAGPIASPSMAADAIPQQVEDSEGCADTTALPLDSIESGSDGGSPAQESALKLSSVKRIKNLQGKTLLEDGPPPTPIPDIAQAVTTTKEKPMPPITPKRSRGRPRLTEGERAKREAEKKAEKEKKTAEKEAEKQKIADARATAKTPKEADQGKNSSRAQSQKPGSGLTRKTPSKSFGLTNETGGAIPTPHAPTSYKPPNLPLASSWTALSQRSEEGGTPEVTMVDELHSSSPGLGPLRFGSVTTRNILSTSPPKQDAPGRHSKKHGSLFLTDSQSQPTQPIPAVSAQSLAEESDISSSGSSESAPMALGKRKPAHKTKYPRLSELPSQELCRSQDKLSTPRPGTSRAFGNTSEDDSDDSSEPDSDSGVSHIPATRQASSKKPVRKYRP